MIGAEEDAATVDSAATELRQAWDDLIGELQAARDTIDDPSFFPPAASRRVLAEGYRYLAGFLHHGIERAFHEDPDFPGVSQRALDLQQVHHREQRTPSTSMRRSTAASAISFAGSARRTTVTGAEQPRAASGRKAPQYLIFEVSQRADVRRHRRACASSMPGVRTGFGNGSTPQSSGWARTVVLELLLAPEKPGGLHRQLHLHEEACRAVEESRRQAIATPATSAGRQLFYDWERRGPSPDSRSRRSTAAGTHAKAAVRGAGGRRPAAAHGRSSCAGHMKLLARSSTTSRAERATAATAARKTGRYFMPVNGYNQPNAASSDTGGGMSTNIYAGGLFDLEGGRGALRGGDLLHRRARLHEACTSETSGASRPTTRTTRAA